MSQAFDENQRKVLTQLATVVWGAFGDNGLNGDVKKHGEQIGELYGRDEALKDHIDAKFSRLYGLVATLIVSILLGAGGIMATLVMTGR